MGNKKRKVGVGRGYSPEYAGVEMFVVLSRPVERGHSHQTFGAGMLLEHALGLRHICFTDEDSS